MSMYSINSSVPKTMVRHIVKYYADYTDNDVLRKVLLNILIHLLAQNFCHEDGEITQRTESIVGP